MKNLGAAKQIIGIRITRDSDGLRLSHEEYMKKVLNMFNMGDAKPVSTLLPAHFKLSNEQSPTNKQE